MSVSYKEATKLLLALQEIELPEAETPGNVHVTGKQSGENQTQTTSSFFTENGLNISALSLDSCDARELMHCYQIALDFGVPTARRALALYQTRSHISMSVKPGKER